MILELENISKIYPGVVALDEVSLQFEAGEVHALMGENGAGKSTLIKVIAGAITPNGGKVKVGGNEYTKMSPKLAKDNGIAVIYQDINLIQPMSVAENIFFGSHKGKLFSKKKLCALAQELFDEYGFELNPAMPVMALSSANQQLVEICKAISNDAKIMIMDEPTAALASHEVDLLFDIIKKLKAKGVTVVYISHRLDEVFAVSDRISILRDGQYVDTVKTAETSRTQLIALMVGRELGASHPPRANEPSEEVVLKVEGLTGNSVENISFELHKGEILGIAGLVGAGRTEMAELICGSKKIEKGTIEINGKTVKIHSPSDAIRNGIGLIPEDRKKDGCIIHNSVLFNTTLLCDKDYMKFGIISSRKRKAIAEKYKEALRIKVPTIQQSVGNLSGGNQQKVIVAKTMAADMDIIFFDEPTKGIDVGAKYEIYQLMNDMTAAGKSIIMISSDMEEILGVSDRIIVLYEGQVGGEITKDKFTQENILTLASGLKLDEEEVAS